MLFFLSLGLPVVAMAALLPVHLAWEALLNHHPAIESILEKTLSFNIFEIL